MHTPEAARAQVNVFHARSAIATLFRPLWHARQWPPGLDGWVREYLCWLLDECGVPVNAPALKATLNGQEDGRMTLLDLACTFPNNVPAKTVLEVVFARGGTSWTVLDWGLLQLSRTRAPDVEWCQRRLLDAGAHPRLQENKQHLIWLDYDRRQNCRAACLAVLSLAKLRRDLRDRVAPGVWRMVAQQLWCWHFCVLVHPPPGGFVKAHVPH